MTVKQVINKPWKNESFHQTFEEADSVRNKLASIWSESKDHEGMQVKVKRLSDRYVVKTRLHPDFDVVVEAFDKSNGKTSAGNKVYDNTINKNAEGDFSPNEKGKLAGYDILQIRLAQPESLFFLNEYSDMQGFVSPKIGFDRKIPYILEPSISHKGDINLTFNLSKDEATNKYFKTSSEQIICSILPVLCRRN